MVVVLDFKIIKNKKLLFEEVKRSINNEEFYGNNLDAFWDAFRDFRYNTTFKLVNLNFLEGEFRNYVNDLIDLLKEINKLNSYIGLEM